MRTFIGRLSGSLIGISGALILGGCGGNSSKADTIQVRLMSDLTGPIKDIGLPFHAGRIDHLNDLNANGGIHGRRIEYEEADSEYNPTVALERYLNWKQALSWSEVITMFGFGTDESRVLSERVTSAKMPFFTASCAGSLASPLTLDRTIQLEDGTERRIVNPGLPYNYFVTTDYSSSARAGLDFIASRGGRTITFANCSSEYCSEPVAAARPYAIGQLGMTVYDDLEIQTTDAQDTVNQKVKDYFSTHPTPAWIWLAANEATAARIIQAMGEVSVKFMTNVFSMSEGLDAASLRLSRGKVHGIVCARPYGDTFNSEIMADLVTVHDRYRAKDEFANVYYVMGYATVAIWSIAVERVLASGAELNRESLQRALESMSMVKTGALLKPVSYSQADHRPSLIADVYQIDEEGKFKIMDTITVARTDAWLGW